MRTGNRMARARLNVEHLEDRTTPAAAYALSGMNLLAFDTANPTVTTSTSISGITMGETLVGIDFRPQNGFLYGLGIDALNDRGTLYSISTRTGVASVVGPNSGTIMFVDAMSNPVDLPDPSVQGYGFDFNPAADRVRVVAGSLNFRINPNTGAPIDSDANAANGITPDTSLTVMSNPATSDAAAYTNSVQSTVATPQTTQYVLDAATSELRIQNPPNNGTQTTVATVTLNGSTLVFDDVNGFDIPAGVNTMTSGTAVTSGSGFAVLTVSGSTNLYTINLVTGAATLVGTVGTGMSPISGFAVQNDTGGAPAIGLRSDGTQLARFNTSLPGTSGIATVTGVASGETLVAIDYRPATGQLYGLGIDALNNTGTLYLIDPQTGAATIVNTANPGVAGAIAFVDTMSNPIDLPVATAGYGIDFNPTVDRLRVVTGTGLNFRVNPNTGAPIDTDGNAGNGINPDGSINGLPMGSTGVSATAYTNSFGQSLTGGVTTQYTLDAASNMLFIQNPPNNGTQVMGKAVTLNGMPLDFTDVNGFDISGGVRVTASGTVATGSGTAVLTVGSASNLYSIDLTTGAATLIGAAPIPLIGLAIGDAPAGTVAFSGATFSAAEGGTLALNFTRTGGTTGTVTATVTITGGTATAGADFVGSGPFTITFADGSATATLSIPVETDTTKEGAETITFALSMPTNGALLGTQATATATVVDVDARAIGTIISSPNSASVIVLATDGTVLGTFTPFAGAAGVRTALGDITGDGIDDVLMTPTSGAPVVAVIDGATGAVLVQAQVFDSTFGTASMAVGDFNNDGKGDILIGSSVGGLARVFDGATGALLASAQPLSAFAGGFSVAAGDIDGDGFDEIVLGTTTGSGRVFIFSPTKGVIVDAVGVAGTGVAVALGDLDGDARDDLILGALTGAPTVRVVYATGTSNTFTVTGATAPLSVAAVDVDRDGLADVAVGSGSGGRAFAFAGDDLAFLGSSDFGLSGIFVG